MFDRATPAEREINLLPLRFRQRTAARRTLTAWARVAAAMVVVCGVQVSLVYNRQRLAEHRVAVLEEASQPVRTNLEKQAALQARHQELLTLRSRLDALIPSDDLLQTFGAIATATVASESPATRLQSLRIDLSGATPRGTTPAASSTTHVAFTAIARDELSLRDLISRLRENARFQDVRLRSTSEDNAVGGRRAEIEAAVRVEKELPQ
ncbi:hypothetical protein [Candidatus Laterigemmans baculatus]|uniref:hypothetical protein n=1 Tax=Candidatus Laterigemmans baculatus TaxID=2770505 RepID=UPI0013DAB81F|nr:hypothetical protein [Candidatus Laterigemmans baculatus]